MENLQSTTFNNHLGVHTYFDNDALCILYDKFNNIIVEAFKRPPSALEFRQGVEARLMAIRKFMTGKVISGIKLFRAPIIGEEYWAAAERLEKVAIMGYSYSAMVVPQNMIYNITIGDTLTPNGFPIVYFYKREAAFEWIMMH